MRGLNAPPRRRRGAGRLDRLGRGQNLLFALDRAGPGDHADRAAADRQAAGADHGRLGLHLAAGDFVGGEDRHDFGHARPAFQRLLVRLAIVADGGDHGPLGADDHVGLQAQRLDALDHVLDVGRRGLLFHDDDHGSLAPVAGRMNDKFGDAVRAAVPREKHLTKQNSPET